MKLSVESYEVCRKFGYKEGLRLIKDAGFDAVDFSYYDLEEDTPILGDDYVNYAKDVRRYLDEIGLVCNQAHAPFNLRAKDKRDSSVKAYADICRSIESAAILGAKTIIVHHQFTYNMEQDVGMGYLEFNYKHYKEFEPLCKKFGICISVENMFYLDQKRNYRRGKLSDSATVTEFIRKLDSPYFNFCADIGHLALTEDEPEYFIEKMSPDILKALHVHDNNYHYDEHMLPYMGKVNWNAVMKALKKIGYEGDLTLEICSYLANVPDVLTEKALAFAHDMGRYLISLYEE